MSARSINRKLFSTHLRAGTVQHPTLHSPMQSRMPVLLWCSCVSWASARQPLCSADDAGEQRTKTTSSTGARASRRNEQLLASPAKSLRMKSSSRSTLSELRKLVGKIDLAGNDDENKLADEHAQPAALHLQPCIAADATAHAPNATKPLQARAVNTSHPQHRAAPTHIAPPPASDMPTAHLPSAPAVARRRQREGA